ncbi:TIGR03086 family metal-binding protein [Nocardiopsis coralliicola]
MVAGAHVALLDLCTAEFARRVEQVDAAQHLAPTPCSEWTVRDLVFHVATGNGLAVRLLTGTAPGLPDHVPSWAQCRTLLEETSREQRAAFLRADDADPLEHPAGRIAAGRYAALRGADIAVHAWDLARATGQNAALDGRVVEGALVPYVRWVQGIGASAEFAAPAEASNQDSRQRALLRSLGRDPRWQPRPW